jgi:RNA polymerase primary sigma factor
MYRHLKDTHTLLLRERDRLYGEVASTPPGLLQLELAKDLEELQEVLDTSPFLKHIERYRNKIIEHNLKLVLNIANKYSNKGLPFDDLFQAGIIGFIRAIDKYDPSESAKLSTYAVWWIRQKITRELSTDARMIRLPVYVTTDITKVLMYIKRNKLDRLNKENMRQIGEALGFSMDKMRSIASYVRSFYPVNMVYDVFNSAQMPDNEDGDYSNDVMDMFEDSHSQQQYEDIQVSHELFSFTDWLDAFVDTLDPISRYVLANKVGLTMYDVKPYTAITKDICDITGDMSLDAKRVMNSILYRFIRYMMSK